MDIKSLANPKQTLHVKIFDIQKVVWANKMRYIEIFTLRLLQNV